ncbi:MAG TPA: hypothetical protein VMD97_03710 [Candidatus Aquilonibacter sp.]|nr:hypothetical protein [Candidatus Aquilonibacter sp.]
MDRRRFLSTAATASALAWPAVRALAQGTPDTAATLTIHPDHPGPTIPANYIGLSYEIEQLSDPSFFSRENTGLIEQFRALSPNGVLRLGGNTSDVGWWKPTPASKQPPLPSNVILQTPKGEKSPLDLAFAVTPEAVHNLRAFLDVTGWTCLYGINLGTGTPARAAEEAESAHKILGPKLEYFQIGNEPDDFPSRFRDRATWNADSYFNDWIASANAVRERVPSARFGMPDVGGRVTWFPTLVERLTALKDRPDIAALTHHYYFTGPPSNPKANFNALLEPDPRVTRNATIAHDCAQKLGTLYRMTEGNTCYRGGKPGFSDAFGAALWAADYALLLASLGYAGINLHGGSAKQVANSLGGRLPGDALITNPNEVHPRPFYTPIAEIDGKYVAEPDNFGLRFAGHFAGGTVLPLTFSPGAVNATAYAAKLPTGQIVVAIINKDEKQPLHIDLAGYSVGHIMTAPSLDSRTVDNRQPDDNREASIVPPITAMLLYSSRA